MVDVVGTPQPIKGTIFKFKSTSGGTFGIINKAVSKKIPSPTADVEDVTAIDSECVIETNQINNYGDFELEVIFDRTDTVHAAMLASVGSRVDAFIEITHPDATVMTFSGNVKSFADKSGTVKNNQRADFKMHCNNVPVFT